MLWLWPCSGYAGIEAPKQQPRSLNPKPGWLMWQTNLSGLAGHTIRVVEASTRILLVPLIGDIWSLIVGTSVLIEGRRRV